jgi:hypothetical protein
MYHFFVVEIFRTLSSRFLKCAETHMYIAVICSHPTVHTGLLAPI